MVTDDVLIEIIEEIVNDKIDLVQIVGRRDSNKEGLIRELKTASIRIKKEVRNRFRKKPIQVIDITQPESTE